MRAVWRVYLKPFDDEGNYQDWVDVTEDVDFDGVGNLSTDLDNTEYDIGVYRNSNFTLRLRNDHGRYSDVGTQQTIFKYARTDSLVKITHDIEQEGPHCGFAICGGSYLCEETTVFTGLLNDESLSMDLDQQKVSFTVLGREAMFLKTVVPFGTISNGDLVSEVLYACLNQPAITELLTVDAANISVGALDQAIDSIASLQNKTVQETLNKLLLAGNSVLWIDGDAIKISPRTPSADVQQTFYGQTSPNGPNNINTIKKIKSGLARVFNYVSWKDVAVAVQDETSVARYGARVKELDFEFFTDAAKQQNILTAIKNEFSLPKQEFDLYAPFTTDFLALKLLDRVSIDYPDVAVPGGAEIPIWGSAVAGEAAAPKMLLGFSADPLDHYKIMGRSIKAKGQIIKFKMRAI